jgi:hypothetical protein
MKLLLLPCKKIAENFEAGVAGFFGMELDAHDVVAFNGGSEGFDVMRCGCGVGGDGSFE